MSDDLLEQLRARNPVPGPLQAPPIEQVQMRIAAGERAAGPRWVQWTGPALAVGIAAAVGTVAIISLHAGRHVTAPVRHSARRTVLANPRPGPGNAMRGSLRSPVLGFGAAGRGVIAWTQFTTPSTMRPKDWLATTSDDGRSWSVGRQSISLFADPVFEGSHNAWTQATDAHQTLRFFVTHNGGGRWSPVASTAAANAVDGDLAVAGDTAWAVGTGTCVGTECRWTVMRGSASGDRLTATAGQPLPRTNLNATTISASSATTAYVVSPARHGTVIYATDDGGRRWHRIPDPCSAGSTNFDLTATSDGSLWQVCIRDKQFYAMHSGDGGARWSSQRLPFVPLYAFEPVSAQVAWSQDVSGTVYRTADGGASWEPVWRAGGSHPRATPGVSPILSAQSEGGASLLVQLRRGPTSGDGVPRSTNLIVYRTSDAGHSWRASVIPLPRG